MAPDRIDLGNQALLDDELVTYLAETQIPLTLCPMSNVAIQVYRDVGEHLLNTGFAPQSPSIPQLLNLTLQSRDSLLGASAINLQFCFAGTSPTDSACKARQPGVACPQTGE